MVNSRLSFPEKVAGAMPALLVIWLVLTVLGPHQDLYKVFFHAVVIPAVITLLATRRTGLNWCDPLLLTALGLAVYASTTTFLVGVGPLENHVRAARWGLETVFLVLALFIWMPSVVRSPLWWGRLFVGLALTGALASIVYFILFKNGAGRLTGLGALHNPIQGSSILLAYFALGHFMLLGSGRALKQWDLSVLFASATAVLIAVLLSDSRAPIGAAVVYFLFIGGMRLSAKPNMASFLWGLPVVLIAAGAVVYLYGIDAYIADLQARGMSYRLLIWKGLLQHPPDNLLLGYGAGTDVMHTPAAEYVWEPENFSIGHAHNLFLGTFSGTGLIGLGALLAILGMIVGRIFRGAERWEGRLRLLGIMGLVLMLTFTGSHTLVSSAKAVWLFAWIPLIWLWFWPCPDVPDDGWGRETAPKQVAS